MGEPWFGFYLVIRTLLSRMSLFFFLHFSLFSYSLSKAHFHTRNTTKTNDFYTPTLTRMTYYFPSLLPSPTPSFYFGFLLLNKLYTCPRISARRILLSVSVLFSSLLLRTAKEDMVWRWTEAAIASVSRLSFLVFNATSSHQSSKIFFTEPASAIFACMYSFSRS